MFLNHKNTKFTHRKNTTTKPHTPIPTCYLKLPNKIKKLNMNNTNKYLNNGFYLGLISSLIFIVLLIFMKYFYRLLNDFDTIVVGILGLTIAFISTLGLIKSTKELKTYKKIIGMILNIGFVLMFIYAMISSVFDI